MSICSIEACSRPTHGLGLCSMHYQRLKSHGDPHFVTRNSTRPYIEKSCSVEGCKNKYNSIGYCAVHRIHALGQTQLKNEQQRKKRAETGNIHTRRYEKTVNGFLMRAYRNMYSRVMGIQKKKAYLYLGKSLLPKNEFYEWTKADPAFRTLFSAWEKSKYSRRLTPSINRINPDLGYELGNIEWLTFIENSRLGSISPNRKTYYNVHTKRVEPIKKYQSPAAPIISVDTPA